MTKHAKAVRLAGTLTAVLATAAPAFPATQLDTALREGQARVIDLGVNASAITYWESKSDGWHVVTTVDIVIGRDGEAEKHAVVRFSAVLLPGQMQLVSVPVGIGQQQLVLRIRRLGDRIEVARVPSSSV
jgi:hypothetical protein